MLDYAFQPDGFARGLRRASLQRYVDDVDVEMVVRGLIMHVQLELIGLDIGVYLLSGLDKLRPHVFEPRDMLDLEVPQTPDVPALHDAQQVEGVDCFAVPVQVGQEEEALVTRLAEGGPVDDILDLFLAFDDIEHPVQPALVALGLHVWSNSFPIDIGCLFYETDALFTIFLDVLFCAGVDQINLKIGEVIVNVIVIVGAGMVLYCAATGHVPVVDVIGTKVLQRAQAGGYGA